ncbi:dephospho-CoA kinase [Cellulomonas sp. APG4]|nr:dephospho-CoA kinase [Cellulomonas sp. APG4]NCT89792.1 dephospho-CoA kinase [Cellulomonas sp. APG4]
MRVGLTGGIAAGKSTVARRLAALGAVVVDHDVLAREVVEPGSAGLAAVVEAFGPDVLGPLGELDRGALGRIVFADPRARERLNSLLHPRIRAAAAEQDAHAEADGARVVVHDIPLLVESGQAGHFDVLVVVDAPAELRVRRLVQGRGMGEAEAWQRVASQAADDERLEVADEVLDGSGSVAYLERQVDEVWARWTAHAGER